MGANSGPLTQRTHLMYRDREDVITDLRVHSIPGIMDFVDYSAAASGMTYRSSTLPGGATIAGHLDHRICMSFAVAGLVTRSPVTIDDMAPVATSFPNFETLLGELQS